MIGRAGEWIAAVTAGQSVPSAPAITRAQLLAVILASVLLLLAWLVLVTVMRRALKGVPSARDRAKRSSTEPTAWQQAGQRARAEDAPQGPGQPPPGGSAEGPA